jgi:hypothetical protein
MRHLAQKTKKPSLNKTTALVPHSQGSLRENPKFLPTFEINIRHYKEILTSAIVIQARHSEVKKSLCGIKLCVFHKRKLLKLTSTAQVSFMNKAPDV